MSRRLFKSIAASPVVGSVAAFLTLVLTSSHAVAQTAGENADPVSGPVPWGMGFQPPVTPVMENLAWFHDNILLWLCIAISAFVLILLLVVAFRFRESKNPTPSMTTHNSVLEVAWTAIPALILIVIAFPSFSYLYYMDRAEDADMTLKVTGYQWYWGYEYPDHGGLEFEARMIPSGEETTTPRLLGTDNVVVVPSDTTVRVLVTADPDDVLHSWAMQPFGVKTDAVPGRTNETWFRVPADKEGYYYGQCSEICGKDHSFMPIMMQVVSKKKFEAWTLKAAEELALGNPTPNPNAIEATVQLAQAADVTVAPTAN
ncbi:MAG: cytochrome c oxidase subunit II [Alphaproteobacteria bacterium]